MNIDDRKYWHHTFTPSLSVNSFTIDVAVVVAVENLMYNESNMSQEIQTLWLGKFDMIHATHTMPIKLKATSFIYGSLFCTFFNFNFIV